MKAYDHKKIESKWQKIWNAKKAYKTQNKSKKKKYYVLDMFPYPSGAGLHVGHPKGYIGSDVFARTKRMQGYNVLHPMGYDAFGLPAEQYAIEHNINPAQAVEKNVKTFERQLSIIGLSYDWERRVNTTDPSFYKWTQWIFLKIYNSWYDNKANKARSIKDLVKIFNKEGNEKVNAVCDKDTPKFSAKEWKEKSKKEKQDVLMKYRLAYEGYAEVNWCPQLGTVLANDEVVDGKDGGLVSERGGFPVEKKLMRQWFMRITAYADRLLLGLDGLNWSNHIKEIQKNWIGKSEGINLKCKIKDLDIEYEAYDSVPQTFMAQTFTVIAPEHPLLKKLVEGTDREKEVLDYAKKMISEKVKLGEDYVNKIDGIFTGRYVWYEPAKRELPIWVASFAVMGYGTGIVNCSFHDERDFAFAKKFNIPLHPVTEPLFVQTTGLDAFRENDPIVEKEAISVIVKHWQEEKYLILKWKKINWSAFVTGGVEKGEVAEETAKREILEETGYFNFKSIKQISRSHSKFYHVPKKQNIFAHFTNFYIELENGEQKEVSPEEKEKHDILWLDKKEVEKIITAGGQKRDWDISQGIEKPIIKNGILTEPKEFAGREWGEVREDIIDYIVKKGWGERKTNYKMRDAIFARQRYWGEPIPLIHDKDGLITELPENKLPLKLPPVKSYKPTGTGESPLANVKDWLKKGYETNTMPGWAGSSWYFLRYMDPKNKKAFVNKASIKYWKNVDMYVGGQEHATGHLLYSRFWHKFLKDYGLVETEEPFQTLRNQGMILGTDNRKMSKRWGNVINPDEVVKNFGADTLRLYEMFMGPFEASLPWSTDNIVGSRRFLERVWKISQIFLENNFVTVENLENILHKTIKKVTEDIETFSFNTAVSSLMILLNEIEKQKNISKKDFEIFIKLLSPFAPHVAEEIWSNLGHKNLIVLEDWPKFDEKKMQQSEIKIIVQVNGKMRAEIFVNTNDGEEAVKEKASQDPTIAKYLSQNEVKKVIYVSGRLVNFVVQ